MGCCGSAPARSAKFLPPVFLWWRDFATRYVTALCHAADPEGQRTAPAAVPEVPAPPEADLAALALTAPLMPGAEYLTTGVLRALWAAMAASLSAALVEAGADLQGFPQGDEPRLEPGRAGAFQSGREPP
jgi:hypothetical protein